MKCSAAIKQFNSLGPSDTIWRYGSILAQVMACCLMAPSHYLNQCWHIIRLSKVQSHSSGNHFTQDTSAINHWNQFENYLSKFLSKSPRGQWVNSFWPIDTIWHHISWSTLVCCQVAPGYYLNQCWLIISQVLCDIHLTVISVITEMVEISILDMSLKIADLK